MKLQLVLSELSNIKQRPTFGPEVFNIQIIDFLLILQCKTVMLVARGNNISISVLMVFCFLSVNHNLFCKKVGMPFLLWLTIWRNGHQVLGRDRECYYLELLRCTSLMQFRLYSICLLEAALSVIV